MSQSLVGSSTAVEIHAQLPVQIPLQQSDEGLSPLTRSRVKFRGTLSELQSDSPTNNGNPHPGQRNFLASGLVPQISTTLYYIPSQACAILSLVCTNIFLFRRPWTYASELDPVLKLAQDCNVEGRPFMCASNRLQTDVPLPNSVLELKESWDRYLEEKIKEWTWCTRLAGFLSAFVLVALQVADKNDPATRVLAHITFVAMFFCLMINQNLFPRHLQAKDVHFAYHLFERMPSTWNISVLLSMSSVSTWWVVLLSGTTFASVYYHDTKTSGSTADVILLSFSQMVAARVSMAALILLSAMSLFFMHATLKRYGNAIEHKHISALPAEP